VPEITATGTVLTVTDCDAVELHPLLVTVTVYVPLVVKVLVALVVALPPLQRYVPPPDAVKVTLPQAVAVPEMAAVGRAATLNVAVLLAEMVLVHPLEPPDCN
jgi:hypothetical protein